MTPAEQALRVVERLERMLAERAQAVTMVLGRETRLGADLSDMRAMAADAANALRPVTEDRR